MTASRSRVRCAIYTRKSSEEGLEQSFNSLQAQREACEAYIASQRHEGWQVVAKKYDDGGFSGGNMNRPGLKQLLDDIAARLVDTVVVYKVDRLTRSLTDFAKIIEVFDKQGVSFVSVTQQFNTTSSMGRLTLNVLLSFAQFEREVTGERIRDKIAASKKKGMWMGGVAPLGYDVIDRQLIVNPQEAKVVREIFTQYVSLGSVAALKQHMDQKKLRTKVRTSAHGHVFGGKPYSRGGLYKLLNNEVYTGRIAHRGESYTGEHQAILESETWEKVKALLAANNQGHRQPGRRKAAPSTLAGLVFDAEGNRYTPTHAVKKGRRYRYYTSQAVIQRRNKSSYLGRIPARELEQLVSSRIQRLLASPQELAASCMESSELANELGRVIEAAQAMAEKWSELTSQQSAELVRGVARRIVLRGAELEIEVDVEALAAGLLHKQWNAGKEESHRRPEAGRHLLTLKCSFTLARRRGELRLVLPDSSTGSSQSASPLLKAIVMVHDWKERIIAGEIYSVQQLATEAKLNSRYAARIFQLAALSPGILDQVVRDGSMADHSLSHVISGLPLSWHDQGSLLSQKMTRQLADVVSTPGRLTLSASRMEPRSWRSSGMHLDRDRESSMAFLRRAVPPSYPRRRSVTPASHWDSV
jgi:DNA invertase Pin-like site-specific DNA recombinase